MQLGTVRGCRGGQGFVDRFEGGEQFLSLLVKTARRGRVALLWSIYPSEEEAISDLAFRQVDDAPARANLDQCPDDHLSMLLIVGRDNGSGVVVDDQVLGGAFGPGWNDARASGSELQPLCGRADDFLRAGQCCKAAARGLDPLSQIIDAAFHPVPAWRFRLRWAGAAEIARHPCHGDPRRPRH